MTSANTRIPYASTFAQTEGPAPYGLVPGEKGAVPGGTSRNLEFFSKHVEFKDSIQDHQKLMLADAQTSGGLLISLSEKDAYSLSSFCNKLSIGSVQIIGKFTSSKNPKIVINL